MIWHLEEGANSHIFDGRVMDEHGDCVAFVSLGSSDAPLVAAAPDLLAFADAYLAMADEVTNKGANARPTLLQLNLLLAKAREVRAKATGAA